MAVQKKKMRRIARWDVCRRLSMMPARVAGMTRRGLCTPLKASGDTSARRDAIPMRLLSHEYTTFSSVVRGLVPACLWRDRKKVRRGCPQRMRVTAREHSATVAPPRGSRRPPSRDDHAHSAERIVPNKGRGDAAIAPRPSRCCVFALWGPTGCSAWGGTEAVIPGRAEAEPGIQLH